jgi:hypothetical protein
VRYTLLLAVPLLALPLAIGACGKAPDGAALSGSEEPSTSLRERVPGGVAITALGDLVGEYRVAGVDDAEIRGNEGIALSIDGPQMSFEPTCAGFIWRIDFDGAMFSTARQRDRAEPPSEAAARAVCALEVTPARWALAEALDAATYAQRTPSNGIRLSGGGHSVTIYSQ